MPAPDQPILAPGARVAVRDEEWRVRSIKGDSFGGRAVHVSGLSELVKGRESVFLTALDEVRVLLPEETQLVRDDSPKYRRSRLYLDALLRRTPATDDGLYVGHRGAIRRADYQLQPAAKALSQLRPRILMADGVGLGKTIEVGVLLSELIQRGRGDRILVVALKSILSQFQKDLWARFTIPLVRLDSVGVQRVQSKIPSNMNPFYYFDKAIISIDTLKRDQKYRRFLEQSHWDVVVVDECQHVAERGADSSQRARLARLLGRTSDALILTSATPHDGRPESFASLMNLLEPTAISNTQDYDAEEVRGLFIRRFKKDVAHQVPDAFCERDLRLVKEDASPSENAAFELLHDAQFKTIGRERGGKGALFRTTLLKAFLSSPAACLSTVEKRLQHKDMKDESDAAVQADSGVLNEIKDAVEAVSAEEFSKFQKLTQMLRDLGFSAKGCEERMVIFSERIDTLKFLSEILKSELKLKENQIEIFCGTLDDQKQQGLVESFGTKSTPIRILLASDAASEGINLHHYCHRMVHFDIPWSIITLEQRNGRIDRFGQKHPPEISYLLTIPSDPEIQGDLRVLERLIDKEAAAHKNLGDVAWLMGLHQSEKEQEQVAKVIEGKKSAEEAIPDEAKHVDFMEIFATNDSTSEPAAKVLDTPLRLFSDELEYAREAFEEIFPGGNAGLQWEDHLDGFILHPPEDLKRRFEYLPPELLEDESTLKLTVNRQRVMDALEAARQDEKKWPEWQLFWEQHPVAEWLDDRVLGEFQRHEAPVLRLSKGLTAGDRIVVFHGVLSNKRSQPVVVDWFGVRFGAGGSEPEVVSLEALVEQTGLSAGVSNPPWELTDALRSELSKLLKPAVAEARSHMRELRRERADKINAPLREGVRKVKRWHDRRIDDLETWRKQLEGRQGKIRRDQAKRLERDQGEVEKRYQARRDWINEGMRTEEEPYLRVAAVLIAEPSG